MTRARPALGRVEICSRRFRGRPGLVIFRRRHRATGDEVSVPNLVFRSLARTRPCSGNGLLERTHREPEVSGIDAHERLTTLDRLSSIDQAFQDLPGNAEPQVALNASCDDSGERAIRLDEALDETYSHQRSLRSRVC